MRARKAVAILFWIISFVALLIGAFFVWILKDGLGPDEVDSHGLVALQRFAEGIIWILGFCVLPLSLVGCALWPWQRRQSRAVREAALRDETGAGK